MGCAEVLLKRNGSHCRRNQHFAACVQVIAISKGARKGIDDQVDSFQRHTVAKWMDHGRGERFDAVSKGVRASCGREFGRKIARKFGIENDETRQQFGIEENRFPMRRFQSDDRTPADLAAGTGSSGNPNKWQQSGPVGLPIEINQLHARFFHEQTRGFANIQRAPTAESDYCVALLILARRSGLHDIRFNRIWMNPVEEKPLLVAAIFSEDAFEPAECRGGQESRISNDQGPFDAKFGEA